MSLKPPGNLSFDGNVSRNYEEWLRSFEFFAIATELSKKGEPVQCATFLHVAGPESHQIHSTMTFADDERDKIEHLKRKFREYCSPKKNVTVSRYYFNTRQQKVGEKFDTYLIDLKTLMKDCEYGELADSLLKDRIVCGIIDDEVRKKTSADRQTFIGKSCQHLSSE
jgi:hypothetical protein